MTVRPKELNSASSRWEQGWEARARLGCPEDFFTVASASGGLAKINQQFGLWAEGRPIFLCGKVSWPWGSGTGQTGTTLAGLMSVRFDWVCQQIPGETTRIPMIECWVA